MGDTGEVMGRIYSKVEEAVEDEDAVVKVSARTFGSTGFITVTADADEE